MSEKTIKELKKKLFKFWNIPWNSQPELFDELNDAFTELGALRRYKEHTINPCHIEPCDVGERYNFLQAKLEKAREAMLKHINDNPLGRPKNCHCILCSTLKQIEEE
jgi:hypothetical protein